MDTTSLATDALTTLQATFTPERWARLEKQAVRHAADLPQLCARLLATSGERHSGNAEAALFSAANRLLLALGSTLQAADVERFEAALKNPSSEPKRRKGGKHDPAPVKP